MVHARKRSWPVLDFGRASLDSLIHLGLGQYPLEVLNGADGLLVVADAEDFVEFRTEAYLDTPV